MEAHDANAEEAQYDFDIGAIHFGFPDISESSFQDLVYRNAIGKLSIEVLKLSAATCNERLLNQRSIPEGIFTEEEINELHGSVTNVNPYTYTESNHPAFWSLKSSALQEYLRIRNVMMSLLDWTKEEVVAKLLEKCNLSESLLAEPGRLIYTDIGSTGGIGGDGAQSPPPFLAGGPWAATQFQGKSFRLEPVLEAGFMPGRRPGVGGAVIDHPHRYATLHVIDIDGKVKFSTTDFSLSGVQKQIGEKFKVVSTFDGEHLLFQCEKGKIYQFNFKMLDSQSYDWMRSFELNWSRLFRGTQLAKSQCRLYIMYGASLVGGYPLAMTASQAAESQPMSGMSISMYITDDVPLPNMKVIDRGNGVYQWKGENFIVGDGVNGRMAIDSELPIGSKGNFTPGADDNLDQDLKASNNVGTYDTSIGGDLA